MLSADSRKRARPPRQLIITSGSHTTSYGALNALATGVGSMDPSLAIHYGLLWFMVLPSVEVEIQGRIPQGVYAKDIILHIIGRITAQGEFLIAHPHAFLSG